MGARTGITVVKYPTYHRYQIDGRWAVGVTTALKGIPKDELTHWAAREVAEWVATHPDRVATMVRIGGYGPTVGFLKELPWQKRDDAAVRGTEVHAYADQLARGDEVEVPDHLAAYVEAYVAYLDDYQPTTVHSELIVGNRTHMVGGRLDSIDNIPGFGLSLVDIKTSRGVYGEYALQVAAYRNMEFCMYPDGVEQPMPHVERCFILHIQPGAYELIPVQADTDVYESFLAALNNYRRNVQSKKLGKLLGDPVTPPNREAVA